MRPVEYSTTNFKCFEVEFRATPIGYYVDVRPIVVNASLSAARVTITLSHLFWCFLGYFSFSSQRRMPAAICNQAPHQSVECSSRIQNECMQTLWGCNVSQCQFKQFSESASQRFSPVAECSDLNLQLNIMHASVRGKSTFLSERMSLYNCSTNPKHTFCVELHTKKRCVGLKGQFGCLQAYIQHMTQTKSALSFDMHVGPCRL